MVWGERKIDGDTQVSTYTYDAPGRRIRKVVPIITTSPDVGGLNGDIPAGTTDYLYDGVQCIEERDAANDPIRQYDRVPVACRSCRGHDQHMV